MGSRSRDNREVGLQALRNLLKRLTRSYPDVRFLDLGTLSEMLHARS